MRALAIVALAGIVVMATGGYELVSGRHPVLGAAGIPVGFVVGASDTAFYQAADPTTARDAEHLVEAARF